MEQDLLDSPVLTSSQFITENGMENVINQLKKRKIIQYEGYYVLNACGAVMENIAYDMAKKNNVLVINDGKLEKKDGEWEIVQREKPLDKLGRLIPETIKKMEQGVIKNLSMMHYND